MLALSSYFRSQRALTSLALFAVALGGCFLAGIAQTETAPSAVVHLTLDGEAVMEEQTPGPGWAATMVGFPPSPFVSGVISNALAFSGGAYINLDDPSNSLVWSNGISLSALFVGDPSAEQAPLLRLTDVDGHALAFGVSSNGFAQLLFTDPSSSASLTVGNSNGIPIRDGQWHHLVGLYDPANSHAAIWVDGVADAMGLVTNWNPSAGRSLILGDPDEPAGSSFSLDEVWVFDSVLSSNSVSEILGRYEAGGSMAMGRSFASFAQAVVWSNQVFWTEKDGPWPSWEVGGSQGRSGSGLASVGATETASIHVSVPEGTVDRTLAVTYSGVMVSSGETIDIVVSGEASGGPGFPLQDANGTPDSTEGGGVFPNIVQGVANIYSVVGAIHDPAAPRSDVISENSWFAVGTELRDFQPSRSGELVFVFHDALYRSDDVWAFAYADNTGGFTAEITRKGGPKIIFSIPLNGTNLTVCAGTTNTIECAVTLSDGATAIKDGNVDLNIDPTTLGVFTNNQAAISVPLDTLGKAKTAFVAQNGGTGNIYATGKNLKDPADNTKALPDSNTTNITVNVPKVDFVKMWETKNPVNLIRRIP